ncbi:hypothetical protein OUZ56_005663 [Daphnia magna]|uniref:Uncharacterized protein n=1 Tax=Daphnia magna TaxID=35525 RepID=A0ABQ9YTE0_9CRUS|nr:hypothetical protein OUZ56_005663 [Daphnia magna]
MAIFRLTEVSLTPSLFSDLVPSFTPVHMSRELVAHSFIFIANVSAKKNKRFTAETRCVRHVSFLAHRRPYTTSPNRTPESNAAAFTSANET